ncbi:hypothetical protein BDN70DRAFT_969609 [Pholiota conissans]|uniref:Uncharacterized protein n=1 Tax=Pholiota conissans TaxID=109636 RepID=A0A9P6CZZ1_9AGAR|nr:hypothetical protein BDN70DRAFT_969609 [Pholiota conissans]
MYFRHVLNASVPFLLLGGQALAVPLAAILPNSSQSLEISAAEAALHDTRSMGGFALHTRDGPEVLSYDLLQELLAEKKIEFPKITEEEIEDRSKLDGLSKTVAVGQTTWFVAQCITRKIQGLVTTELELVTVAFAVLNVFIYFFWWNKPMDVHKPVPVLYLEDDGEKHGEEVHINAQSSLKRKGAVAKRPKLKTRSSSGQFILSCIELPWKGVKFVFRRVGAMTAFSNSHIIEAGASQVPRFYALGTTYRERCVIMVVVAAIGALFGALHCIGWNYIFPTHAEAIIWRTSSVAITGIPALMAFTAAALYPIKTDKNHHPEVLGILPYIIARLLLLVEAFISLRQLPPSALLAVRWTAFLPHVYADDDPRNRAFNFRRRYSTVNQCEMEFMYSDALITRKSGPNSLNNVNGP